MAYQHKVQVTLSNEVLALIQVEQDHTGDSYSTCVRRAIRSYYADHAKTATYTERMNTLSSQYAGSSTR